LGAIVTNRRRCSRLPNPTRFLDTLSRRSQSCSGRGMESRAPRTNELELGPTIRRRSQMLLLPFLLSPPRHKSPPFGTPRKPAPKSLRRLVPVFSLLRENHPWGRLFQLRPLGKRCAQQSAKCVGQGTSLSSVRPVLGSKNGFASSASGCVILNAGEETTPRVPDPWPRRKLDPKIEALKRPLS